MNAFKTNRSLAILTGAVLLTPALFSASATPAHADKSETYKTGAVVLGAAAAYLALQGKTLPAAVAAAGGYYAYKKGQDAANDERYGNYYGNYNNGSYNNGTYNNRTSNGNYNARARRQERRQQNRYDNAYSRNGSYDSGYDSGSYGNSGYDNSYNRNDNDNDDSYDNSYNSGYDNSYDRNDNGYRGAQNYGQWKKAQRTIR